jgi:uncharacterized 2Fe-2S/4Fe-4S cluster protein (DUF4445 family)
MTEAFLSSWITFVSLPPPSLENNTADADRLLSVLKSRLNATRIDMDLSLLRVLADRLRHYHYQANCILFKDRHRHFLVDITDAREQLPVVGLAVDLGTSRVVLRLLDLISGRILSESAFDNPQIAIGPDILTRVHYANTDTGTGELHRLIIDGLNHRIADICRISQISPNQVYAMSLAGNTAMTHLFLGLNPRWMIREPYIPVVNTPDVFSARELGIAIHPAARIFAFPNVGSYFGGDLIAGILYAGLHRAEEPALLLDVGTNAEVVLGDKNWLIACAGAAGPALEGGVTRMGMMAGPGVIDRVTICPDTGQFTLHTIDEAPPRGICGSGVIDLAAQMFLAGLLDIQGRLVVSRCGDRLTETNGMRCLLLVPASASATGEDLIISQADFDSLIRSKAAMYTILRTLTGTVGVELDSLSRVFVAGTFGSFINPTSAVTIGMLPDLPLDRYQSIGNSSLGGATRLLTAPDCLAEIDQIRERVTYLELNVNQEFMNRFSAAKFLPHTDRKRFPSVKLYGESASPPLSHGTIT